MVSNAGQTFLSARSQDFLLATHVGVPVQSSNTGDWKVARTGRQECLPYGNTGGPL